jgi:cobalt/nickel transport system permease protein
VFAAQMINLPVAPGTSGHLVGAALAAVLLGPWRALIVMTVVLAVQALLFQDGGLSALGANLVDMGLGSVLSSYAVVALVTRRRRSPRALVVAGVLAAFAATLVGATLTAVWLGLSGLYPLSGIVPVMLVTHVAIGLLEAALTGAILVTVVRWRPDLLKGVHAEGRPANPSAVVAGIVGLAVAIAAFLSPFASTLPDGLASAARRLGFATRAEATWPASIPELVTPFFASARIATAVAGAMGTVAVAVLAWIISRGLRTGHDATHE